MIRTSPKIFFPDCFKFLAPRGPLPNSSCVPGELWLFFSGLRGASSDKGGGGEARLLTFSVSCGRYSVSAFDHSVSPIDNAHIRLPYGALGNRLNECGSMRSFSYVAIMRPLARQKKPLFADALEIQTSVGPQKKERNIAR